MLCFVYAIILLCVIKVVWPFARVLFLYTVGKTWSKRKYLKEAGDWAIVTGCTAGIGKAYAKELAKDGLNIMLISRDPTKLKTVADEIESSYHVKTVTVTCDFTKEDIYDNLKEQIDKLGSIACLVNNVGMSYPHFGKFVDAEFMNLDFIRDLLHCNVNSTACLTRIVLPSMLKRNQRGCAIINLSSFSGLYPFPYLALYSASKAFIHLFTEALANEAENSNITFQTVCPMMVATQMSQARTRFSVPSADDYAKSALDMLGVESVTLGWIAHALHGAAVSINPALIKWAAEKSYQKWLRKKQKQK